MSVWVQGMPESVSDATMTWQAVLHYRLTAQYSHLGSRGKTAETESTLGWPHYVYFFVGRPHPDYGASVGLHEGPADMAGEWAVTPFDTGGMVHGRVVTHDALSAEEKSALIETWSRIEVTYEPEMDAWVSEAFDEPSGYVYAVRPSHHLVDEIDLPKNTDHSWTWEGRLLARDYLMHPVAPLVVFLSNGRRKQYFEWVRSKRLVPQGELAAYMKRLGEVIRETPSPVKSAQATLTKGR